MNLIEQRDILNKFGKYVVQQSRTNLTKGKKNVGNTLYDSVGYILEETQTGWRLFFTMEDYGMFQDRGVSGTNKKYNTPFSYKPMSNVVGMEAATGTFANWAKFRGLRFRDAKGRFLSYKSIGFILANSIKSKGIKPSLFFTTPFKRAFKRLPDDLIGALGDDALEFLEKQFEKTTEK